MNVSVSGRHMDVTDAIRNHVMSGLEKITNHFDKVIEAEVILSTERHVHVAEINVHANGLRINAKDATEDMYQSIDSAIAKVDRQIQKHKDRIQRHQPRTARELREYHHHVIEIPAPGEEQDAVAGTATLPHRVIHREKRPTQTLTVEEATFQLDLQEDLFLVFTNADSDEINVVYRHSDGTYGLIEPTS